MTSDLDELAQQIRCYYLRFRREFLLRNGRQEHLLPPDANPRWDGGEDREGRRFKPVWPKIAAFVLANNLDPQKLVQGVFDSITGGDPPWPNMLMSAWAISAALAYKQSERSNVEADVQAYREAARRYIVLNRTPGLSDQKLWRRAILQPDQRNPLVSYVLSVSCGQFDLAADFKQEALLEYLYHQKPYDDALGRDLPPNFREEALRLKASLMGQAR